MKRGAYTAAGATAAALAATLPAMIQGWVIVIREAREQERNRSREQAQSKNTRR